MDQPVTRRTVLAGAGAAAIAVGAVGAGLSVAGAAPAPEQASGNDTNSFSGGGAPLVGAAISLAPDALTAGLTYLPIDPTAFHPISSGQGRSVNAPTGTSIVTPPGGLLAPIVAPVGSVLKEITFAYFSTTGTLNLALWKKVLTSGWSLLAPNPPMGLNLANGADIQTATFGLNEAVDGTSTYMLLLNGISATTQSVHGALLGYRTPAQGFIANKPIPRVLDTRVSGGKLRNNEERVVATRVPTRASAAVINLTVTETEQGGFVAVFPANSTWPGNSSINWSSSGQNLANSVITATDPTGHIRIRGGVNPTHVVIDVQGYFA